ncbi:MAG TPA: hypothetical protein PLD88_12100, partial [Candidatus Berkiella sp.]|nr:hypothetical protein [Candidatus Berkiella sp.]
ITTTQSRDRSKTTYVISEPNSRTTTPLKKKRTTSDSHDSQAEQPMKMEEATVFMPYYDQTVHSSTPEEKTIKGIVPSPSPLD